MLPADLSSSAKFFRSPAGIFILTFTFIACLRVFGLASSSLWQDEVVCIYKSQDSFASTLETLTKENQPPLYHFTLHLWMKAFGTGAVAARSLSYLTGLLALLIIFITSRKLFGGPVAWWTYLLAGLSPGLLEFTQEATPYGLYWLFSILGSLAYIQAFSKNKNTAWWIAYAIFRAASIYVHYFAIFTIVAEGAWALLYFKPKRSFTIKWLIAIIASVVLFAPWIPTFMEQRRRVKEEFWTQPKEESPGITAAVKDRAKAGANLLRQWILWVPEVNDKPWIYMTVASTLIAFLFISWITLTAFLPWLKEIPDDEFKLAGSNAAIFFALNMILTPIIVVMILDFSLFTPKYLMAGAPFMFMLIACGIERLRPRQIKYAGGGYILIASLLASHMTLIDPGYKNAEFNMAAIFIDQHLQEKDLLLTRDSQGYVTLKYYLEESNPNLYWWMRPPDYNLPFWQGLEAYDRTDWVKEIDGLVKDRKRVWLALNIMNYKPWDEFYLRSFVGTTLLPKEFQQAGFELKQHRTFNGVEILLYEK